MNKQAFEMALCCLAWGAFGVAAPRAATFQPAPHADFTLDQDSGAGQFSQWQAKDLSGLNALRATMGVRRLGKDPKWGPTFTMTLGNAAESAKLRIYGMPGKTILLMFLEKWVGDKKTSEDMVMLPPDLNEDFGVDMDWTVAGAITVLIHDKANAQLSGFERHEVKINGAPTQLTLVGSTGEIEYKRLQLGSAAP